MLLGCALGLTFVLINLVILNQLGRSGLAAPFKLSDEPVKQELLRVVGSQLSAFRQGDFAAAYSYADSQLKGQFALGTFTEMVRGSYPTIARSRSASFGVVFDNGSLGIVMVGVTGFSGRESHYQYLLRRERAGWRVSGVTRIRARVTTA